MKVKILWGFEGDPDKLKTPSGRVSSGQTIELEDEEYGHQLIGKGLASLEDGASPKANKQAKPNETK